MKFIVDKNGQWSNPGKNTFIPDANGRITMKGVRQPLLGVDDEGNHGVMQPGGEYQFPGNGVYEIPLTEDEAMAYAANGYIVEEMQEGGYILEELPHGGSHEGDPPDNLTFAQKKQAYNDSLTLYNWTKNLRKHELEAESFPEPTVAEAEDNWLYDERLGARADGVMRNFMQAANPEVQRASGNPQYAEAIARLTRLNQEEPGYKANWINVPDQLNQSLSNNWTSYDRPTKPVRKPTMEEAYKNVDKDKYPTLEDFVFAAEVFKETGKNPDPQDFPSRRLPPPPEPQYEIEDIEPEIEIERLPIITPTLTTDNNLEIIGDYDEPEELVRPDYSNYQGIEEVRDRFNPKRRKGAHKMRQRISAKIAQALTGYDAEKMDAEIEAADKEGRRINFENMGLGAVSNKKFRKKYNKEYDEYEKALEEKKYLNTVPRFFKHGGPHDPPLKHEGGNIPPHKHPHQSYRDRWNLEIKQNQDMDMTRHVVNERPLLNLDGTDPDAGYNQMD